MKELLNQYQLNSLLLALRTFEENLRQVEGWLNGKEEHGLLYRRMLNLPPAMQNEALLQINAALQQISDLVHELQVQPVEESPAGLIRGQLIVSWANLMDAQSQKLERYGSVNPHLAEVLDSKILELAQAALDLSRLFDSWDQEK